MFLGIDIGSSSSKAALVNNQCQLIETEVMNMGTGTKGPAEVVKRVCEQANISREQIKYTVVTGYGRMIYQDADRQITEISCHAKGVGHLMEGVRTIIDIGGQDAKVIRVNEEGNVLNFVMNEKCAAGTGRFLEVMARVLGCNINELSNLAKKSKHEISISSVCTVFAESEVISQLSAGCRIEDVAKGAHVAIAKRVAGMCMRVGYVPKIVMSGGVALNENIVEVMSAELKEQVQIAPHPQAVGAIGAACFAWEFYNKNNLEGGHM